MLTYIIATAVIMFYARGKTAFWVFIWPGTVAHELMHWLVGTLMGAKPVKIILWPEKKQSDGTRVLGSVTFHNLGWFNTLPTAIAPLLNIPLVIISTQYLHPELSGINIVLIWALASALTQSIPSSMDWDLVAKNPAGAAFWLVLIISITYNSNNIMQKISTL